MLIEGTLISSVTGLESRTIYFTFYITVDELS